MRSEPVSGQLQEIEARDPSAPEVHLLDVLIVLSRRRKLIAWFTVGTAIVAAIVVLLVPSQYTADTTLLPPVQNSSTASALMGQLGGSGALASAAGASLGIKNPADTYVALLRSRTIEDSLVQRFGLMARYRVKKESSARAALEAHSKVVLGAKDGLINISVTDSDPRRAADIANGFVEEFAKLSANLAITEASRRRIFFQQQLLDAKQNLAAAEEAMKNTQQSTGVLQIDNQARTLIQSAADLRAQIVAKEVQLQAMRSYATQDNPEMVVAEQQLIALKAQLAKLAGDNQDSGSGLMVPKGRVPEAEMEYVRNLRDVKYYDTISELIAKQFEMAKLDEARQGSIVQVVDVAVPPDTRSSPKRTLIVIAAALFGFLGACIWSIAERRYRQINPTLADRQRIDALWASFK